MTQAATRGTRLGARLAGGASVVDPPADHEHDVVDVDGHTAPLSRPRQPTATLNSRCQPELANPTCL
jgi:hypothetical protein